MTAKYDLTTPIDLRPQEWMKQAACRDHPNPDLWFPDQGDQAYPAKLICLECPVQKECAEYGKSEQWGIWGGLSYKAKKSLRQQTSSGKICRNGHEMTPENTVLVDNGGRRSYRYCRKCRQATAAKHWVKKVGYK